METLLQVGCNNAVGAACLAVAAALVGRCCRRPALTHILWLLVLLKLITPPLLTVTLPWPAAWGPETAGPASNLPMMPETAGSNFEVPATPTPADLPAIDPPANARAVPTTPWLPPLTEPAETAEQPLERPETPTSDNPAADHPFPWQALMATLWLVGSGSWLLLAGFRLYRFRRLLHYTRLAPAEVQSQARRLASRLGLARCPGVWLVPAAVSPMLWALVGAPRLLVPSALWDRLSAEERETLLAHELAHLRRRDHWVRCLEMVVLSLYWWHPIVWWARRELREAEEQCCDRWVLAVLPVSAAAYAKTLVETVDFLSRARPALPLAASGIGQAHYLRRRLIMIMRGTTSGQALNWAGFLIVLGLGAVLLPLWPSWAQLPDSPAVAGGQDQPAAEPAASAPVIQEAGPQPANARYSHGAADRPQSTAVAENHRRSENLQAARDEVELMKAQLDVKRAEAAEVQTRIQLARRRLDRAAKLKAVGRGAISNEDIENAQDEVTLLEAQLAPKEAQIREAEVRLRQAQRRLESASRSSTGSSSGPVTSYAPLDAGFIRGPTTSSIRAANDTASTSSIRAAGSGVATTSAADHEQRLRNLETKLEELLKEVNALRRDLRPRRTPVEGSKGAVR